jgi:hypothetical protein
MSFPPMLPHRSALADNEGGRRHSVYANDDENVHHKANQRHLYTQCHMAKLAELRARHVRDHSGVVMRNAHAAAAIAC